MSGSRRTMIESTMEEGGEVAVLVEAGIVGEEFGEVLGRSLFETLERKK